MIKYNFKKLKSKLGMKEVVKKLNKDSKT